MSNSINFQRFLFGNVISTARGNMLSVPIPDLSAEVLARVPTFEMQSKTVGV